MPQESPDREVWRLSATAAVEMLRRGEVSPLELVEAAALAAGRLSLDPRPGGLPSAASG